ncbi:DNA-binding transcriptional regulator, MarR family [Prosthecobacter debontii]|uniref:DNA-binding transcriptional regulator, MarR family n=1 Tax=Prosthecobacter debontii TaxID=48467 RepID=A0A1T4WM72_9BACT|nr:MarR family transcriptional regulator [Prosthecobacter debontii]SKA77968.1 DNA-binding transcriptional regulator, MarR family [Prosthecobacter debontii]
MRQERPITQAQYEHLATFRFAMRQFLRFSETAAQEAGVTPQQHQALLAIKGFSVAGRMTVGELAERLQITHHSAVGLVDRMVTEHLVTRQTDPVDRRRVHVVLTRRGERVLEKLSYAHRDELRRIGPGMRELLDRLNVEQGG